MTLGQKIRALRLERKWSQEELAKKLGISSQRVSKYETDINKPIFEIFIELAKVFGVSVDYLIFDESVNINFEDKELIKCLQIVDKLPYPKKKFIKDIIKTVQSMPENS
jgi:transcriptional regulator with XRE-family HTH domain